MHRSATVAPLLQSRGLAMHYYLGRRLRVGFSLQCYITTGLFVILILTASAADHTLVMEGRNVGLLEHPAIWAFLLLQTVLPLILKGSVQNIRRIRLRDGEFKTTRRSSELITNLVDHFVILRSNTSRIAAAFIYSAGIAGWVWNSYQNQRPGITIPYDFWDSSNHFFGYWVTRFYKLYLFAWLLPYLAMVHCAIVGVMLRLVRRARTAGWLELFPFHADGAGGLGFVASLISTPVVTTLILSLLPTVAAFEVHRSFDTTPLIGLTLLVSWAVLAYVVPILFLRSDIVALKGETIGKLATLEQATYVESVNSRTPDLRLMRERNDALNYLDNVRSKVRDVPNYPHLKRVFGYVGLALTPSMISFAIKIYQSAGPVIINALTRP